MYKQIDYNNKYFYDTFLVDAILALRGKKDALLPVR